MDISKKVLVLPNICGIEIDLTGKAIPSIGSSFQPFYNTYVQDSTAKPAYMSPSKATLSEKGNDTEAGMIYEHSLTLQFPNNDPLRVMRIQDYLKVKYIYIKLSNGMVFFFGRNDFYQNAKPKISLTSTEKRTSITYKMKSMLQLGFTNGSFDFNLSEEFPINFFNL